MHYSYVSPGVHEKELDAEVTKKLTLDMAKPEEVKTQKDMKKLHGYFIMNFPKTP